MNDNEKLLQELNKENPNDYPQGIWNEVASWWHNEVLDKKLKVVLKLYETNLKS